MIFTPPGGYCIRDAATVWRSGVSLVGAGMHATRFVLANPGGRRTRAGSGRLRRSRCCVIRRRTVEDRHGGVRARWDGSAALVHWKITSYAPATNVVLWEVAA